jgi:hypothetical protein
MDSNREHDCRTGCWSIWCRLLQDGRFLVAGGRTVTAEIYDPSSGTWSMTGSMAVSRSSHNVTVLANATVLVAGVRTSMGYPNTEVYTPNEYLI